MKHKWRTSLRVKLVGYGVASLVLALLTETVLAVMLYLMSTVFGVSGNDEVSPEAPGVISGRDRSKVVAQDPAVLLQRLGNVEKDTLDTILIVALIVGIVLFVAYFLLLTRGVVRDLSRIAQRIAAVTEGDAPQALQVKRQDEIGEIARCADEMMEEWKRLVEAEREALQSNKEMIACVAHDLRTPLTSLTGYLHLAMDQEQYGETQRQHFAEVALQKADRLEGLIRDLFDYTKLMSGEITLHRARIDLVKLLEQMIEEFYPLFQENGLVCTFETECRTLEMELDPELMARAVQNLFSNAVKYGKDGKQIQVRLWKTEHVYFSVTNYGVVIPQESLELIFERFYRVEESRSRRTGGTGLGLNITREIVTLHGGQIHAESSLQGTVFEVALPKGEGECA